MPPSEFLRPPFVWPDALGAQQLAAALVASFAALDARPDRLHWTFSGCLSSVGASPDAALARAGLAIAADIDRGIGAGIPDGYHNPRHFLEVLLSTLVLSQKVGLGAEAAVEVLTAAVIHDFHHDGSTGDRRAFRLESLAVRMAEPYLAAAGATAEQRETLGRLVLATEPLTAAPFARACHRHHRGLGPPPGPAPLPELAPLAERPEQAQQAALLTEADVLPSLGLTIAHAHEAQARLAAEFGRPLGPDDKLRFIDAFGAFAVADFFSANRTALRIECLRRLGLPVPVTQGGSD